VQVAGDAAMMAIEPDASVSHRKVQACTGPDGTYEITQARYAGTATSRDPRLQTARWRSGSERAQHDQGAGWRGSCGCATLPRKRMRTGA
jgi:hypothetical protein